MYLINKYALYGLGAFRTHFSFKQIMHFLYRISPTDKTSNFNTKSEYTSSRVRSKKKQKRKLSDKMY